MQRNESFDIMKGCGIILMIVAHTYGPQHWAWNFIYAFHMPLFIIVSGYFFKTKTFTTILKSNRDQLLIPYITMCLLVTLLTQIQEPHSILVDINKSFQGWGPGWFLLALLLVRVEFYFILKYLTKYYFITSLIISTIVCLTASKYFITTYLSFFPSLASLVFFATGYYIKQHELLAKIDKKLIVCIPLGTTFWLITSLYGKVELSQCVFKLSIIDFAGSVAGTFVFYKFSQIIERHANHTKVLLSYTGRFSLVILFFHCIDYCVPTWHLISRLIPNQVLLHSILAIRLLYVAICVIITINTEWLRLFFRIK